MAIYLVSGMSGVGKTTIVKSLEEEGLWKECISYTTRRMRVNEENGITYNYINLEQFINMYENNEFAEATLYGGNLYGIAKEDIENTLLENNNCVIIVDYEGYKQIKEIYPSAIGLFITMSKEECYQNMLNRGDSIENAEKRISTYEKEFENYINYEHILENQTGHLDYIKNFIRNMVS